MKAKEKYRCVYLSLSTVVLCQRYGKTNFTETVDVGASTYSEKARCGCKACREHSKQDNSPQYDHPLNRSLRRKS
jgi:hypothetical protein